MNNIKSYVLLHQFLTGFRMKEIWWSQNSGLEKSELEEISKLRNFKTLAAAI